MKQQRKSEFPRFEFTSPRKLMLAALVLLVVAVGLTIAQLTGVIHIPGLPSPHPADEDFEAHDYEATVTVGPGGFEPAVLRVKPKTRVYFENHDSANHKVDVSTSAPDSGFGSRTQIGPAAGYAFTFTKTGDYKFHDGDNPTANGEVLVEK